MQFALGRNTTVSNSISSLFLFFSFFFSFIIDHVVALDFFDHVRREWYFDNKAFVSYSPRCWRKYVLSLSLSLSVALLLSAGENCFPCGPDTMTSTALVEPAKRASFHATVRFSLVILWSINERERARHRFVSLDPARSFDIVSRRTEGPNESLFEIRRCLFTLGNDIEVATRIDENVFEPASEILLSVGHVLTHSFYLHHLSYEKRSSLFFWLED